MRKTHLLLLLLSASFLMPTQGFAMVAAKRSIMRKPFTATPIFQTKTIYNGTFAGRGYDGMIAACDQEVKGAQPCNKASLLDTKFWRDLIFQLGAWVMATDIACLSATSNDTYVDGTCVLTSEYGNAVTTCTCNMLIPVCCVKP